MAKSTSQQTGDREARDWTQHEHVSPTLQNEAQQLIRHSGSPEIARQAIEAAADKAPALAASSKDAFARAHGFTSYLELFESSSVVRSVDGKNWCVTALPRQRWMLWNEQDLKVHSTHGSLEEAQGALS